MPLERQRHSWDADLNATRNIAKGTIIKALSVPSLG
jgi:hypothetical protein